MTGASINQLLFFKGLASTSSLNAALIVVTIPVFVFLISLFLKKEKIEIKKIIGLVIGLLGSSMIILNSSTNQNQVDSSSGDFYVVANSILFASYFIIVKPLSHNYPALFIAFWMFFFGSIISFPISLNAIVAINWSLMNPKAYIILFSLIVIVTAAGYIVNTWALKYANATNVSFYIFTQPFFTAICALIFLKKEISYIKIICAGFIFLGVYLVNKKKTT